MSLPSYPKYKDSGVEWIGAVPAHWNVHSLKRFYVVVGGSTPKSDVADYWDGDIDWVTPADLSKLSGFEIQGSQRRITEQGLQSCGTSIVPSGSLVLSTRAPIGSVGLATTPVCTNQGCKALVPRGEQSSRFAAYTLSVAGPALNLRGKGTTFLELSGDELANFTVAFPEVDEQLAIATFLDRETAKIDALIAEQETLLALLAEKRQATISHAVTRGLDPNAPMKDSGIPWLGKVPAHWSVGPLKHWVDLKSGGTPSKEKLQYWGGDIPWASAKDLKTEKLADTVDHITPAAVDDGAVALLPPGAVLVVVRGMILARLFPVAQTLVPMAINQDLKGVLPRAGLDAGFLAWLLRGTAKESLQRLDEAGHGTKALRMEAWTSMALPIPPETEQAQIVAFLVQRTNQLDVLGYEASSAIELLRERRSALIAAAVTGQIDVRRAAEQEAA